MFLLWLSLAFLAGILLSASIKLPTLVWLGCAGISLLLLLLIAFLRNRVSATNLRINGYLNKPALFIALVAAQALFLGAARYQAILPDLGEPHFIAFYTDRPGESRLRGTLVEPPDQRDNYALLTLRAVSIQPPGDRQAVEVDGLLLAKVAGLSPWRYGDRLLLTGELSTPPDGEDFSYREYLATQGIYAYMPKAQTSLIRHGMGRPLPAALFSLRERASKNIYRLWPEPEASLLAGILLGVESGIPADVEQAFQETGTAHIIAISGFNMTIVAGLLYAVFGRLLGRYKGAFIAALGILLYTLLVGAGASVVRAALMSGLTLFAFQVGRRQSGLLSLALVAAVMAAANPKVLWNVGYQLSFAATLGLVLYASPLENAFSAWTQRRLPGPTAEKITRPVSQYFLYTLAAMAVTLPIMLYHFGRLSLTALLANPAILPVQPAVMILGGLAVLVSLLSFPIGQLAAAITWPFVAYTIRAVEFFAAWRGGELVVNPPPLEWIIGFYVLLILATFAPTRFHQYSGVLKPALVLALLGVLTVLVWRNALAAPDGRLHLTLLDSSSQGASGEVLLICTPTGRNLLINGGPSASRLAESLGRRLPLGARRLDWLVAVNSDPGELDALPQLAQMVPPGQVFWAGPVGSTLASRELRAALTEEQISIIPAEPGQELDLGAGARMRVLAAGPRGAVFLVEWDRFRVLVPLGPNFEDLEGLDNGREIGRVTALLLADHGYAPANSSEWIANLQPEVVLLSVAAGDKQGRPSPETLQAVEGYNLLRTDRDGWIELTTDGDQLWVEVERH
jgi:competence protein ComEC